MKRSALFATDKDGQVHFSKAGVLTREDLAAMHQQVRARVPRWFARADHFDYADAHDMTRSAQLKEIHGI